MLYGPRSGFLKLVSLLLSPVSAEPLFASPLATTLFRIADNSTMRHRSIIGDTFAETLSISHSHSVRVFPSRSHLAASFVLPSRFIVCGIHYVDTAPAPATLTYFATLLHICLGTRRHGAGSAHADAKSPGGGLFMRSISVCSEPVVSTSTQRAMETSG